MRMLTANKATTQRKGSFQRMNEATKNGERGKATETGAASDSDGTSRRAPREVTFKPRASAVRSSRRRAGPEHCNARL